METLTQHPHNSQGSSPYPASHRVPLGNHTAWAESPPFKKSLNISSHHCHIIKQPIAAAEQARRVMCTTCTVRFPPLTLPITLLNGSPGTIRQHGPCSEVTPGRSCTEHGADFCVFGSKDSCCSKKERKKEKDRGANEICRTVGRGASAHYADLVGLQTWQPALRSGNPQACGGDWGVR